MAGEIPKTRIAAGPAEAERLRAVVRGAETMGGRIPHARIARPGDAAALARLLSDPSIGPRIYTLPDPMTEAAMRAFIDDHLGQRERGTGLLFASFDAGGEATAYFDVEVFPDWSACKFGGAVKPERQGRGYGGVCGLAAVEWCFDVLGAARICETTARDNDRSIRLLSRLGFQAMGEVVSVRPDGSTRPSIYWELEQARWRAAQARERRPARSAAAQGEASA
jgi:RimJ/RimL family protein N-acetyltransferase